MLTRSVGMIYETFPGTKGGSGVKTCLRLSKAEAEGTKAVAPSRPPRLWVRKVRGSRFGAYNTCLATPWMPNTIELRLLLRRLPIYRIRHPILHRPPASTRYSRRMAAISDAM
jgi:hypothetical protein